MRSSTLPHESFDRGWPLASLWLGLVSGPLAWAALLQTNYVLSYVSCETHRTWMLHAASLTALALVGAGALAAARVWRRTLTGGVRPMMDGRARAMAVGGIAMSAWFGLVILATEIPVLVLAPCTP